MLSGRRGTELCFLYARPRLLWTFKRPMTPPNDGASKDRPQYPHVHTRQQLKDGLRPCFCGRPGVSWALSNASTLGLDQSPMPVFREVTRLTRPAGCGLHRQQKGSEHCGPPHRGDTTARISLPSYYFFRSIERDDIWGYLPGSCSASSPVFWRNS